MMQFAGWGQAYAVSGDLKPEKSETDAHFVPEDRAICAQIADKH